MSLVHEDGIEPIDANAERVARMAPSAARRSILVRVGRLGADALALARATAILGTNADLRRAATLAGLDQGAAEAAADHLAGAEVLRRERPLQFTHPIVASAIAEDIAPSKRSADHHSAAVLLAEDGAPRRRSAFIF